jgi:hypothetical protein
VLILISSTLLAGCGGNRPSDQAAAPATPAPAPAEPATPPTDAAKETPPVNEPAPAPAQPTPKPAPRPVPREQAPPPPKAEPVVKTLPAGTDIEAELVDGVSSKTSQVNDAVHARVTKPVVLDGYTLIPAGALIQGTVTEAVSLKKIGGTASLGLRFDTVEAGTDGSIAILVELHQKGKSETGKDAGTIAGATAGGALLGRLLSKHDKTKGTLLGAVVGAAAGTGAAAATKGQEVELPAGTPLALKLSEPVHVQVQS